MGLLGLFGIKSKPKTVEIDYDKLAAAIENAHNRIKEQERNEECNEEKRIKEKWHTVIHYKDYPETKNIFFRAVHIIRNDIVAFFSLIFFKKKYAKDDVVTFGLMRMALYTLLWLIKWAFYGVFIIMLLGAFYSFESNEWITRVDCILFSLIPFLFARLFRVATFEVENMHNRQNLIGILSTLSAFLALIVAIISLVVAVMK